MNDQNPQNDTRDEELEVLTVEVPTDIKAGRPWLPPCRCQNCCQNGGCADGS